MARPLRIEYDGVVYHLTSGGNAKRPNLFFKSLSSSETIIIKTLAIFFVYALYMID